MKPFEKHLAAIKAGRIDRTNIIGIRKAFNAYDRASRGYSTSRTAPAISQAEFDALNGAIDECRPVAVGEFHTGGMKVLRNKRYANRWTLHQRSVIDRLAHFQLVRFDWIGPRFSHCVPVFRAVAESGDRFTFRNIPWQSAWSLGEEDGPRVVND